MTRQPGPAPRCRDRGKCRSWRGSPALPPCARAGPAVLRGIRPAACRCDQTAGYTDGDEPTRPELRLGRQCHRDPPPYETAPVSVSQFGLGVPVAMEPKVRFRLETGPSGEARRTASDPKQHGNPQRLDTQILEPPLEASGLHQRRTDCPDRYSTVDVTAPAGFLSRGVGCSVRPRRARRSEPKRRRYCAGVSPTLRRNRRPKKLVSS
jgi:hypothetical protein